jgi:hypothetical protein
MEVISLRSTTQLRVDGRSRRLVRHLRSTLQLRTQSAGLEEPNAAQRRLRFTVILSILPVLTVQHFDMFSGGSGLLFPGAFFVSAIVVPKDGASLKHLLQQNARPRGVRIQMETLRGMLASWQCAK